jgi:putative endonuclease
MGFAVYILFSEKLGKYYVGSTEDVEKRILAHNAGLSKFTSLGIPWKHVHVIECTDRSSAIKLELKIKKRGIKRFLLDCKIL